MVTDLLANTGINISHFLCSKSEECIPCKTTAKLCIKIYCNIYLKSFLCVILINLKIFCVFNSSIFFYSAYFDS